MHGTHDVKNEVDQGEVDHLVVCAGPIGEQDIHAARTGVAASEQANERAHRIWAETNKKLLLLLLLLFFSHLRLAIV